MERNEVLKIEEALYQLELELKKIKALTDTMHNEFFGKANPEEALSEFSKYQMYSCMIVDHLVNAQEMLDQVPCPGWKKGEAAPIPQR